MDLRKIDSDLGTVCEFAYLLSCYVQDQVHVISDGGTHFISVGERPNVLEGKLELVESYKNGEEVKGNTDENY